MTNAIPTQNSVPGLGRNLLSTFQSSIIILTNGGQLSPAVLVDGVKTLVLGGYAGIQGVVNYVSFARPIQEMGVPGESIFIQNRTADAQQATNSHRETVPELEQRLHSHINSQTFLSEDDNWEEGDQPPSHENTSFDSTVSARSKRVWMWVTVLVLGVLSLVVVPGLVVGIITGQIPWGIALAGATATILSFLAGLYYHHNK